MLFLVLLSICFGAEMAAAIPPGVSNLPSVEQLPLVEALPDPLVFNNGSRVKTPSDWQTRREEIKRMVLYYEYGHMPIEASAFQVLDPTEALIHEGLAKERRFTLALGLDGSIRMRVRTVTPEKGGPFPVIVNNTNATGHIPAEKEALQRGYMLAEYVRTDLDPDAKETVGAAQQAFPEYDWGTLAVWAWGGMRTLDYLLTQDRVDKNKIAITGHSRGGKTALLAGALDERFALVNPNGSGCGGAGCFRVQGERSESLADITDPKRFAYWFHPRFRDFAGKETRLPFDQHFLKVLVAPRALLSTEALEDHWANPKGTVATYRAAQPLFAFLGAGHKNAIHFREGEHSHSAEDWLALLDFADRIFFGKTVERRFDHPPFE
jgi:hypothetical protein